MPNVSAQIDRANTANLKAQQKADSASQEEAKGSALAQKAAEELAQAKADNEEAQRELTEAKGRSESASIARQKAGQALMVFGAVQTIGQIGSAEAEAQAASLTTFGESLLAEAEAAVADQELPAAPGA